MKKPAAFTPAVRQLVQQRAKHQCELCGALLHDGQYHHRNPRRMGGTRRSELGLPSNCLYVHFRCHERIERNRADSIANGWLCYSNDDPEQVPVLYRGRWVLLRSDGSVTVSRGPGPEGKPARPPSDAAAPQGA